MLEHFLRAPGGVRRGGRPSRPTRASCSFFVERGRTSSSRRFVMHLARRRTCWKKLGDVFSYPGLLFHRIIAAALWRAFRSRSRMSRPRSTRSKHGRPGIPHVFGDVCRDTPMTSRRNWEDLEATQKPTRTSVASTGVPGGLPALCPRPCEACSAGSEAVGGRQPVDDAGGTAPAPREAEARSSDCLSIRSRAGAHEGGLDAEAARCARPCASSSLRIRAAEAVRGPG